MAPQTPPASNTKPMNRSSIREALEAESPLCTPLAHDALSARLIERAGFKAFSVGGSAMLAARHAYPDIGLVGLTDMVAPLRDIAAVTSLPFLADADDGYGDVKSVARTVAAYEAIGVGGLLIEDQIGARKRQRAESAAAVVDRPAIEAKLRTALATRENPETLIIGRTDAYGPLGLDEAIRRAEGFVALGADGVFVAGLRHHKDYERVGAALGGTFLSAAMFEGGATPWLSPRELFEMGFKQVSFPASIIIRAFIAMRDGLDALRSYTRGESSMPAIGGHGDARTDLDDALQLGRWRALEDNFAPMSPGGDSEA